MNINNMIPFLSAIVTLAGSVMAVKKIEKECNAKIQATKIECDNKIKEIKEKAKMDMEIYESKAQIDIVKEVTSSCFLPIVKEGMKDREFKQRAFKCIESVFNDVSINSTVKKNGEC